MTDSMVECRNCGVVWSKLATMECPRCGRPENPDWDEPIMTEFERRWAERNQ